MKMEIAPTTITNVKKKKTKHKTNARNANTRIISAIYKYIKSKRKRI